VPRPASLARWVALLVVGTVGLFVLVVVAYNGYPVIACAVPVAGGIGVAVLARRGPSSFSTAAKVAVPFALVAWWLVWVSASGAYDLFPQHGMRGVTHSTGLLIFSIGAGVFGLGGVVITRGTRWVWSGRGERLVGLCNLAATVAGGLLLVAAILG
jgi:hypothetical protein